VCELRVRTHAPCLFFCASTRFRSNSQRISQSRKDQRRARITGGVGAEPSFWRISWTALTLEDVGKSPTDGGAAEVPPGRRLPVAPPSVICEFASWSSPSLSSNMSSNRAVIDDGRQHGVKDQGARARPALGACATRPGHAVNVLTEECLCKRHPGAASMQLHGCARHCRQLCQTLRALNACVPLAPSQPHSRWVMAEHV
jgi:hypothetical protein